MALDQLTEQYPDGIVLIRYHMPFPGSDPFYIFNSQENSERMTYYDITSSSHLYIDGIVDAGYYNAVWDSLFNMQMDVPSPMEIDISGAYDNDSRGVDLSIRLIATDRINLSDLRLQCVTIENHIHWVAPNGLTIHNQVMRDMVPDPQGEAFSISEGDTVFFSRRFILNNAINADSCEFVVFTQAFQTRDVLQAAKIGIQELTPVAVWDDAGISPQSAKINSCRPNPFNACTLINYTLKDRADAIIDIYNIAGQRVAVLNDGNRPEGEHNVTWDASALPSGVYFARLESDGRSPSVKMLLLK